MWDLVSYNEKHNLANGENNRDGTNENYSWNCGIEGETNDVEIIKLRKRQMKNMITILMVSQGVPMILMGDEMAKTQLGNNNAYCQDNETNWLDWSRLEEFKDIFNFYKNMILFRKKHKSLKKEKFFQEEDFNRNGYEDISWHGVEIGKPDWNYESKSLAFLIDGMDVDKEEEKDESIYVALNSYHEELKFQLPYIPGKKWYKIVDTFENDSYRDEGILILEKYIYVRERSSVVLVSK
ncbi:MAG: hypothetical protein MJH09_11145 [Cetobacterium sp.]|nr:hypothetical protein [Cetobacterium sp.]